ncbi:MAG: WYL domain-containing protein [Rhodopirellula sp.]|nr:WYL domain-containing protein [Rhodopirellula sp.]
MAEQLALVRQWLLLRTLSARRYGCTVKELAEEAAVSEKTVRRDLITFQQAGFPLQETVCPRGLKRWKLDITAEPALTFTFDEAVALYLGRRLMEPLAGTLFWEAAQRAFRKVRAMLGGERLKYVDRFAAMFHQTSPGAGDYSNHGEIIDQLVLGIEDRRAVFLTYQSLRATESVTYDAYPYGLIYHRGSLYLVGWSPDHGEIRHWKVDRIENAEVTEFPFQRPDDFDLAAHLEKSFGIYHGDGEIDVAIRFSPPVARYVKESRWHASQKLTPRPDGSLLAEFRLGNTEEIKHWILSFGRNAEVLEPPTLREEVIGELHALLSTYLHQPVPHRQEEKP